MRREIFSLCGLIGGILLFAGAAYGILSRPSLAPTEADLRAAMQPSATRRPQVRRWQPRGSLDRRPRGLPFPFAGAEPRPLIFAPLLRVRGSVAPADVVWPRIQTDRPSPVEFGVQEIATSVHPAADWTAPTVGALARGPAEFRLPETAIEYLLADRSLVQEQRQQIEAALRRYEMQDRAFREAMRRKLRSIEAMLRSDPDAQTAREISESLRRSRQTHAAIVRRTLHDIQRALRPRQWERLMRWIESHRGFPFHQYEDVGP